MQFCFQVQSVLQDPKVTKGLKVLGDRLVHRWAHWSPPSALLSPTDSSDTLMSLVFIVNIGASCKHWNFIYLFILRFSEPRHIGYMTTLVSLDSHLTDWSFKVAWQGKESLSFYLGTARICACSAALLNVQHLPPPLPIICSHAFSNLCYVDETQLYLSFPSDSVSAQI